MLPTKIIFTSGTVNTEMDSIVCAEISNRFKNDKKLISIDDVVYTIVDARLFTDRFELELKI